MKVTITDITEWIEDYATGAGLASREGDSSYHFALATEIKEKREEATWNTGLPFEYVSSSEVEEEAVEEALEAFSEKYCEFDILKPAKCEYDVVGKA